MGRPGFEDGEQQTVEMSLERFGPHAVLSR
jgi:hypothetical protein